jgi:hypothetical protein
MLAALELEEAFTPDRREEAAGVYGTEDPTHPGCARASWKTRAPSISPGGSSASSSPRTTTSSHCGAPAGGARSLPSLGLDQGGGLPDPQPHAPRPCGADFRAMREADAKLLVQPWSGSPSPADVDHYTRVRCYQRVMENYPEGSALLSLLPLSMRMAGPGRRCGTRSSGRTTGARTSSWAGTTPAREGPGGSAFLRAVRRPGPGGETSERKPASAWSPSRRCSTWRAVPSTSPPRRSCPGTRCSPSPGPSCGGASPGAWRSRSGSPTRRWCRSSARRIPCAAGKG